MTFVQYFLNYWLVINICGITETGLLTDISPDATLQCQNKQALRKLKVRIGFPWGLLKSRICNTFLLFSSDQFDKTDGITSLDVFHNN